MSGSVFVYKNDAMIRVPKDDVLIPNKDVVLPCICTLQGDPPHFSVGIAMEYFEEEKEYLVDLDKNKIFSSTFFNEAKLPSKIGDTIKINQDGKLGTEGGEVGIYLGRKGNAILFKLGF